MKILKARNIFFFVLAIVKVFSSPRKRKVISPDKIMVIQLAKLGDMVCTTPVFRAIKQKFPKSKLYVVGNRVNKDLLEGNQDVDEYIVFSKKDNIYRFGKELEKENVDACVVIGPDYVSLLMAVFSNISSIVAPRPVGGKSIVTRTYNILVRFTHTREFKFGSYAPRERLRLLEPLSIFTEDTTKHLVFSDKADKKVSELFNENEIVENDLLVGISPSVGNEIKKWPEERFAKVADHLYEKHKAKLLIIGGPGDEDDVEKTISNLASKTEVVKIVGIDIDQLKALISRLSLFVSVDTGPIYIAEAFNVPTVDIVGPMDEREQPPVGKLHKVVVAPRKKAELHILNARLYNKKEARKQTEDVTSRMVIDEIDALMKELI